MDVRVFIGRHPNNFFQVSIVSVGEGRSWHKMYPSKRQCVNDLCRIGLLTLLERYDALQSEFDSKDSVIVIPAITTVRMLDKEGFVETVPNE
jgi:hypothetical protein